MKYGLKEALNYFKFFLIKQVLVLVAKKWMQLYRFVLEKRLIVHRSY